MFNIVLWPAQALSSQTGDIVEFDNDLKAFVEGMVEAMYASGGIGLAAPQVGVLKRLIVVDPSGGDRAGDLVVLVNPTVTWSSKETSVSIEGCLSLPGVSLNVTRPVACEVRYNDVEGNVHLTRFTGLTSRIVQHEVDHLHGSTILDMVGPMTKRFALKEAGLIV